MDPKYALLEIERRWLVDETRLPDLSGLEMITITDLYIADSRLRLRRMETAVATQYKLCKKYGKHSPISEPITNIYLSAQEYTLLRGLPGKWVVRCRYHYPFNGVRFNINKVIQGRGPTIVEAEFPDEAAARKCTPPPFCTEEISSAAAYESVNFALDR